MKANPNKVRPYLEALEDRFCPSLTVRYLGGNLFLSGTPTGTTGLTINGVAPASSTAYTVTDGSHTLGTFNVPGSINLNLAQYQEPISVDLAGHLLGGNILMSVGLGNTTGASQPIRIYSSVAGGRVGGSVTVTGGSGNENVNIGQDTTSADAPVRIGGSVQFTARNGAAGPSNAVVLFNGSSIGKSLTATGVESVQVGEPSQVAGASVGSLNVNGVADTAELSVAIDGTSTVLGNVSILGTSQFTGLGDLVSVQGSATIGGSFNANLGDNVNLWTLGGTFNGPVTVIGGGGAEVVTPLNTIILNESILGTGTSGTFNSSFTAITGSGSTEFLFPSTATGAATTAVINGNLTLNFGNGNNDLGGGAYGGVFAGIVNGNINITLGSGNDTATIQTAPTGLLNWHSGNGNDSMALSPAAAGMLWNVNLHFGNGNDTLNLTAPGGTIIGTADGGGGTNTFIQDPSWTIASPWSSSNF